MGRSPQDVEDQIGYPLTVALLGIPEVKTIRSYSMFGFSSIYIIFNEKADFYWSRTRVLEKLNSLPAGTLPEGVQPALGPDATALGQIYLYTLEGRDPDGNPTGGWDLNELRTAQDWYVRYALTFGRGNQRSRLDRRLRSGVSDRRRPRRDAGREGLAGRRLSSRAHVQCRCRCTDHRAEQGRVRHPRPGLHQARRGHRKDGRQGQRTTCRSRSRKLPASGWARHCGVEPWTRMAPKRSAAFASSAMASIRWQAIKNIKHKIEEISPGLPTKVVIDYTQVSSARS